MMYLQTPKRPSLPPTPSSYKTSLPPLSSILAATDITATPFSAYPKLPSVLSTPTSARYMPKTLPTYVPNMSTPSRPVARSSMSADTSDADISISEMRKPRQPAVIPPATVPQTNKTSFAFISHSPATFPSQEPSIDNAPLARRKRRRTSPNELSILNTEFEAGSTPNKMRRIEIAGKVNMTEKAVQIWFQNKRQSIRKQLSQEKEVTELPPTPPIYSVLPPTHQHPQAVMAPLISSTPTKPVINKSHSFVDSPVLRQTSSPIKQRSSSIPLFTKPQHIHTSDDSMSMEDETSINSSTLVLNETKKKQPVFLNSAASSTMTFKLTRNSKITQKLTSVAAEDEKENIEAAKIKTASVLDRKPLASIDPNANKSEKNECVENLLSLRAGNWA